MAFRLKMKTLSLFGQQAGVMLEAGLPMRRALATLERGARGSTANLYARLGEGVDAGRTLSEAMAREGRAFPPLFQLMVAVGERVGGLDRILKRLADYYDFLRQVYRKLLLSLIWPMIEYWGLIFVLAVVAYIRNMIAADGDAEAAAGRMLLLGAVIFATPIFLYFFVTRALGGSRIVHELLLRTPILGRVSRNIAIGRFSWVMEMMTGGGVRIFDAVTSSFEATANPAFAARAGGVVRQMETGVPLHEALQRTGLFPYDYIEMVHVSQESGTIPDVFARLAREYFDRMQRAIAALGAAMFWLIWLMVAAVIIGYIFFFALQYVNLINSLMI